MAGRTKWADIKARRERGPGYTKAREDAAQAISAALTLDELRRDRGVTQVTLAEMMGRDQGAVSRTERQDDWFVSTIRDYVESLGGRLEIRAVFDDESVEILPAH
ncbi:MAG: XRE family transcriptional regulator [Chloroflexi bacterium]|nr:XRE family transcriptional regulator [Chloroflexota bacterium]